MIDKAMPSASSNSVLEPALSDHRCDGAEQRPAREVRIEFMGIIADLAGVKALTVGFPGVPTLRELIAELERRFGPEFSSRIYRNATEPRRLQMCARIFVNSILIDDRNLDLPILSAGDQQSTPEVLVFILPAACGG